MSRQPHRLGMDEPAAYQIRVQGRISQDWINCFDDMTVAAAGEDGGSITELTGRLADQAALYGLLGKLYTLGLVLLLVKRS